MSDALSQTIEDSRRTSVRLWSLALGILVRLFVELTAMSLGRAFVCWPDCVREA